MKSLIHTLCILVSIAYSNPSFSFQGLRRAPKTELLVKRPYAVEKLTPSHKPTTWNSLKASVLKFLINFKNRFSTKTPVIRTPQLIARKQPLAVDITPMSPKLSTSSSTQSNTAHALPKIKTNKTIPEKLIESVLKTKELYQIKCPNPTKDILNLLRFKSLSTFEQYIKNKEQSILKKMEFTKEELDTLNNEMATASNAFTQHHKIPKDKENHDHTIPQLQIAQKLLKERDFEPSSLIIRSAAGIPDNATGAVDLESLEGTPISPDNLEQLTEELKKQFIKNAPKTPNDLSYIQQVLYLKPINDLNDVSMLFTIYHEIGHLVRNHAIKFYTIESFLFHVINSRLALKYITEQQQSHYINKLKKLLTDLSSLYEWEADLFAATVCKDAAQINLNSTIKSIKAGDEPGNSLYLNNSDLLYLFTKIGQLQEKAKTPLHPKITPDITKE